MLMVLSVGVVLVAAGIEVKPVVMAAAVVVVAAIVSTVSSI